MPGKVILVKTSEHQPMLIPATALSTMESGMVLLDRALVIDNADAPTDVVPQELCFEFDADLMNNVNSLTHAGLMNLSAAQQLCKSGLEPAEFITDGQPKTTASH